MKKIIFALLLLINIYSAPAQLQPCDSIRLPQYSEETKNRYEKNLAEAKTKLTTDSLNSDFIIWHGRRTAYMGNYMEAIEIYSKGIKLHADNARFYRHRGHRFITVRCFDKAIADLAKAAEIIKDQVDEIEVDGIPNAANLPTSTLKTNIYYHLGLAYYIQADFNAASAAFKECLELSDNADMYVATANWLYITLKRMGKSIEADDLMKTVYAGMDLLENQNYLDILLMYKNNDDKKLLVQIGSPEEQTKKQDSLSNATLGFGLGNYYLIKGQKKKAKEIFEKVVAGNQWASFGFIAAEAELKRMK